MDEPTAALGVHEVSVVLNLIKAISDKGVSVILISHRLQDIMDVCSRVVVLYEGENVANLKVADIEIEDLVTHIVGGRTVGNSDPT
jgi:simple sugar transport system ATP-binding protein